MVLPAATSPAGHAFARPDIVLAVAVGGLLAYVVAPYVPSLVLSAALAIVLHPLHRALLAVVRSASLAATLTVISGAVILLLPLSWLLAEIGSEAAHVYAALRTPDTSSEFIDAADRLIETLFPGFDFDVERAAAQLLQAIASSLGGLISGTFSTVIELLLGTIACWYFLRDGQGFVRHVLTASPLAAGDTATVLRQLHDTVVSVIRDSFLVCLGQGLMVVVAMELFGVPRSLLWGSLAVVAAIAPGIGPSMIVLPTSLFLAQSAGPLVAAGFCILAMSGVWAIGNVLGPLLISRGARVHELWIIVSVIGGIAVLGPLGFVIGPLLVSTLAALVSLHRGGAPRQAGGRGGRNAPAAAPPRS